jgi:hypothetical protein
VSWAARKGSKTTKTSSVPTSEDGSDDGPRPSTGSFKTNVGTRGASFNVDDWQPDFNGSEAASATGSVRGTVDHSHRVHLEKSCYEILSSCFCRNSFDSQYFILNVSSSIYH